jgi:hypothetical protein
MVGPLVVRSDRADNFAGSGGLLVNFFDRQAIVVIDSQALKNPERFTKISPAARISVMNRFDLETVCLPKQIQLVYRLLTHGPFLA